MNKITDFDALLAASLVHEESTDTFETVYKDTNNSENKTKEIQDMNHEYQKYLQMDIENQKKKSSETNEETAFEELSPRTLREKRCQYYEKKVSTI